MFAIRADGFGAFGRARGRGRSFDDGTGLDLQCHMDLRVQPVLLSALVGPTTSVRMSKRGASGTDTATALMVVRFACPAGVRLSRKVVSTV